jgi:REP element-mobilizing transposase RayT
MDKNLFNNKYRIPSTRAKWWDYRTSAPYFITICTKDMKHLFGFIQDGEMHLNQLGTFAYKCFKEIPNHFPFTQIINFIVMPNHVHGLIHIHKPVESINPEINPDPETTSHSDKDESKAAISPKKGSLASIVRSYKSAVTKYANENNLHCGWQERFHDHIVRNDGQLKRISEYISNNPRQWDRDKYRE